jgi:UDP-2,3-diacylglucosamine hydrolase
MNRIALIAGRGRLPLVWAEAARKKGIEVFAFPIIEEIDTPLKDLVEAYLPVNIGTLDRVIGLIKNYMINKVVMIGKVAKTHLFIGMEMDKRMKDLLSGLDQLNDDSILLAIVNELEKEGIRVLKQSTYIEDLLAEAGVLTSIQPNKELYNDMKTGFELAKEIARVDIGQTILVKNRAVLAVEAIEGTDEAIKRGGFFGGKGAVMAKVSKPMQDWRFDIPTVGLTTIKNLIDIKARGLVVEAGKTFLLERERLIAEAENNNIAIVAMDYSELD